MRAHTINKVSRVQSTPHVFALWGDQFEEEIATTFVTRLRKADIRVQIVGVAGPVETGIHGVTLRSDISIAEAEHLARHVICVVLPCDFPVFSRVMSDRRMQLFMQQAEANGAQFVGHKDVIEQLSIAKSHDRAIDWVFDDDGQGITDLACRLADELVNVIERTPQR